MLYVFHVDCGRMMKFDMNMALSRVENLKHTIELLHGFPTVHQVLLVSGGEILLPETLVCSYSAGTDTNPIYMFTTEDSVDKTNKAPWPSIEPNVDLKDQVERCLSLPATYSTVVQRAQLAQQIFDLAREEEIICEKLVHEQHLQQQGWSAVIANMEDLVDEFRSRYQDFQISLGMHMDRRNALCEVVKTFDEDIESLAKIPVLSGLLERNCEVLHGFDEIFENDEVLGDETKETSIVVPSGKSLTEQHERDESKNEATTKRISPEPNEKSSSSLQSNSQLSLLQWISSKENHPTLRTMSEECQRGLALFDERKLDFLKTDVSNILRMAQQDEIKEIKGLEDRLCGLEKLMFDLKKIVQEQRELATAFQQNQNRASNLGDPSILPDLCASHRSQLLVMLQSQRTIRDIRRRISKAKEELADNLYKRLKYIVHIENTMSELDNSLLFYHRCLKRVDSHLSIITQIHQAPTIYVTAVIEVVRRRVFSTAFSAWASNLACDLLNVYRDEISRRREFNSLFRGHFLCSLFPGMQDMPPSYASQVPYTFDGCLPKLTKSDIDMLSTYLPDVATKISCFDMRPVIEFFNSRSGVKNTQEKSSLSGKLQSIGGAQLLARPIEIYSHLKDGFESETDTEEFEKVGQSPNERKLSTTTATTATSTSQLRMETMTISTTTDPVITHTVETLTETPKKPSRVNKLLITSKSSELTLPAIPETDPPKESQSFLLQANVPESQSSSENPSPKTFPLLGHHNSQPQRGFFQSPTSPYRVNNLLLIDNEFINSEFYIDESLPSSLKDYNETDEQEDDNSPDQDDTSSSYQSKNKSEENTYPMDVSLTNNSRESLETVIGLLQENLGSTTLEVERLKGLLKAMSQLSFESLRLLRTHLQSVRSETEAGKIELQTGINKLSETWVRFKDEYEVREIEEFRKLKEQHQLEISSIERKQNEIQSVYEVSTNEFEVQRESLNGQLKALSEKVNDLETKLQNSETDKERALFECREKIVHEHKTEIESLRCRFKLMTSMERSPSDTSLEKIERLDFIDITTHETKLQQIRDDFNIEKEQAIQVAIANERSKWEQEQQQIVGQQSFGLSNANTEAYRKIIDEKEKQLDIMRERDLVITKENSQLKLRIEALANEDESGRDYLKDQLSLMTKDRLRIEQELSAEKAKRIEMESSVATMKVSTIREPDGSGGSSATRSKMASSQSLIKHGVQIETCNRGDTVFVVWNNNHGQYVIVQEASTLFFLHGDSHNALNLKAANSNVSVLPDPYYCIGRVVDKEYCHARKDENRYRVPKGTKFYRVKVQPIVKAETSRHYRRERNESTSSASSVAVSRSTSTQHLIDSFAQTDTSGMNLVGGGRDMTDSIDCRDRTISVTEEDDEPISLLSDRYRCVSLSEEEEKGLDLSLAAASGGKQDITTTTTTITTITATTTTTSTNNPQQISTESSSEKDPDDSDEYRSLEAKDEPFFSTDTV